MSVRALLMGKPILHIAGPCRAVDSANSDPKARGPGLNAWPGHSL